jgi:DNA-binding SARP family transcriptional activator
VLQFRILGPLEVLAGDDEPLPLGGQKQRALLAVLLLRAREVVSTEFLVDALWGEQPPRTATASLQNSISALRKLLGADLLRTRPPGYVLEAAREAVDLGRFEQLVAEARGQTPVDRAATLREALSLWRGPALAEFAFDAFALPEARRLEELRIATQEEAIDADLERGAHAELVPELESLVAQHPLRERLRGQLMLALYGAGRQADALSAYQSTRRTLVEELGVDPSPQLQQLHASILRQEVALPATAAQPTADDHLAEVTTALLAGRLVPVLGTSVTEIADRLARRFSYPPDEAGELTRVAQYVALTKGAGPLYDELHELLAAGAGPTPVHRFLAALPPLLRERGAPHQLIVTTSYDLALEQAFLDAGEEFDVVAYLASGRERGRFCHVRPDGSATVVHVPNTYAAELSLERRTVILKLHGGLDRGNGREWESFVVTEDDYIGYLADSEVANALPVALAARLRRSHLLFLGLGMRDWNLRLVLARVWGAEGPSYRSWAVLPGAPLLEREFWRARAIDLVDVPLDEYAGALGRYAGLEPAEASA